MHHLDRFKPCGCTVFLNKDMNLKMLCIHSILIQIEDFFSTHQNFDGISDYYNYSLLKNFIFFVHVEFQTASQLKRKRFVARCSLETFFVHLKSSFDLNKLFDVDIRMICEEEFNYFKKMKSFVLFEW